MIYVTRHPFIKTRVPHLDANIRRANPFVRTIKFTPKEQALLTPTFTEFNPENKNYDLVYIVKEGNANADLKYSLRSVCKFCQFRKIWIVGYKPNWVKNVGYIHTKQIAGNKWKNSMLNYEAACDCSDISENFILMNDDFFAIRQIVDWKESTNRCLGTINNKVKELKAKKVLSRWQEAFSYAQNLLTDLKCTSNYNYETHLPIIINKQDFKVMLKTPLIQAFMKTPKVLHKRSIYKNLFQDPNIIPKVIKDVKIEQQCDLDSLDLTEDWISVYDYTVDNFRKYPRVNKLLQALFPDKCAFEV